MIRRGAVLLAGLLALTCSGGPGGRAAGAASGPPSRAPSAAPEAARTDTPPVFAYYYLWFNPTSWQRAKRDRPALGPYSSVERRVMEQHVRWAKAAGIDGFLVSWKRTETNDYRLARLVEVAHELDFKLGIVYQGLDFDRQPLPAQRVTNDVLWLADTYGDDRAFRVLGDRPLVMWSGTWKFSEPQIELVSLATRPRVTLLASERNALDYESVAAHFDGNSYYWGAANPETYPRYEEKLASMGRAVHDHDGLWIAPFAPGFDARLVGGTSRVSRRDGETLRTEWNAALGSSPDALGLISWNEFSENTHVEPSEAFGHEYLQAVADLTGSEGPVGELDSSAPEKHAYSSNNGVLTLLVFFVLAVIAAVALVRRRREPPAPPAPGSAVEEWV